MASRNDLTIQQARVFARMDCAAIRDGIYHLQQARDNFALAEAPRTLQRIRLALKSAEGALRHAQRRVMDPTMRRAKAKPKLKVVNRQCRCASCMKSKKG